MSTVKSVSLLFAFGALAALSAAPLNLWVCGFVMLFPYFYFLENSRPGFKSSLLWGYLFTLSYNVFISSWLLYTIVVFGHIHWTAAIVIFLLYTLITSSRYVFFILLVQLWNFLQKQPSLKFSRIVANRYFSWTFCWGMSEYFGWQLFHALGANHAGGDHLLIQSADLVGVHGLSLFWFLINLALYDLLKTFFPEKNPSWQRTILQNKGIIFTATLALCLHLYGFFAAGYYQRKNNGYEKKRIALVQGNTPLAFEANRSVMDQVLATLQVQVDLTTNLLEKSVAENKKPDLVVWSESSVPFLSYQTPGYFTRAMENLQGKYEVPMIINDVYLETVNGRQRYYNNLWLLNEKGKPLGYYHKIELLPFGEFIPFADLYPEIYDLVPEISGFTPGTEKKILSLNSLKIIPSICYELLSPTFTLDFFKRSGGQGQVIINLTNDTWFGLTTENALHMKASSLRAVELRLPILRATNSGISGYVDTTGQIHEPTKSDTRDTRIYEVPIPDKSHSPYSVVGLWPFRIFLLVGGFFWLTNLGSFFRARKK